MKKKDFLNALKSRLNGELSDAAIAEHIRYYDDYIEKEKSKGSTEEEILQILGDPNMIARTIIDAAGSTSDQAFYGEQSDIYEEGKERGHFQIKRTRFPSWIIWIILAVVLFCVVSLFFKLLPVLVIGGFVLYLIRKMGR